MEEAIVKLTDLSIASMANQKNINVFIKNVEIQVCQLAKQLHNSYVGFLATTKENPKVNCNAIMTRSGLVTPNRVLENKKDKAKKEEKS